MWGLGYSGGGPGPRAQEQVAALKEANNVSLRKLAVVVELDLLREQRGLHYYYCCSIPYTRPSIKKQ